MKNFVQGQEQRGKKFEKHDYRGQGHNNNNKHTDNFPRRNQGEGLRKNQMNEQRQGGQEQEDQAPVDNRPIVEVINAVMWGLSFRGPSSSARKRYAKVHTIMTQEKKPRTWKDEAISFRSKDLEGVHTPHDGTI